MIFEYLIDSATIEMERLRQRSTFLSWFYDLFSLIVELYIYGSILSYFVFIVFDTAIAEKNRSEDFKINIEDSVTYVVIVTVASRLNWIPKFFVVPPFVVQCILIVTRTSMLVTVIINHDLGNRIVHGIVFGVEFALLEIISNNTSRSVKTKTWTFFLEVGILLVGIFVAGATIAAGTDVATLKMIDQVFNFGLFSGVIFNLSLVIATFRNSAVKAYLKYDQLLKQATEANSEWESQRKLARDLGLTLPVELPPLANADAEEVV